MCKVRDKEEARDRGGFGGWEAKRSCAKQVRRPRRFVPVLKCCVLCLSRRPLRTFGVAQEQTNGKAAGSLLRTVSHVGACPAGGLVVDSGQQSCGEWPSSPEPVRLTYIAITHLSLSSWLLILLVQWYGRADATQQVLGSNRESLRMENVGIFLMLTFDMCCVHRPVEEVEVGSRFVGNESLKC